MEMTHAQRVGASVRAEMARHGITQQDLAAALGITQTAVSRRIRGTVPFDVAELPLVAAAIGCDVDTLLRPAGLGPAA